MTHGRTNCITRTNRIGVRRTRLVILATALCFSVASCRSEASVTPSPVPSADAASSGSASGVTSPGVTTPAATFPAPTEMVSDSDAIFYGWGAAMTGNVTDVRRNAAGDDVLIQPVAEAPAADGTVLVGLVRDYAGPNREGVRIEVRPGKPASKYGVTVSILAIVPDPAGGGRVQLHVDPPRPAAKASTSAS